MFTNIDDSFFLLLFSFLQMHTVSASTETAYGKPSPGMRVNTRYINSTRGTS